MSHIPDLQPIAADTVRPLVVRGKVELQPPLTNAIWTSDASTSYQLNARCQDFITRYLGRSLITPNDPNMTQVNRKLLKLAFTVGFIISILSDDSMEATISIMGLISANIFTVPFFNARLSGCGAYI